MVQACPAVHRKARLEVPSTSEAGVTYTIDVSLVQGIVTCTCPGFRFRGTCHHTQLLEEQCGWVDGGPGAEEQTAKQCSQHVCPRCGSATIELAVGVEPGPEDATPVADDSEAALRAKGIPVPAPAREER